MPGDRSRALFLSALFDASRKERRAVILEKEKDREGETLSLPFLFFLFFYISAFMF